MSSPSRSTRSWFPTRSKTSSWRGSTVGDAPKKTLQLASVIGREFTRRLVDRLGEIQERTEEFLRELKAIELIYEKSLSRARLHVQARSHARCGVQLSSVPAAEELHRVIGLAIEDLYASRLAEQYEVLGHHFLKAEEWPKALRLPSQGCGKGG